jgi:hypothetical protein
VSIRIVTRIAVTATVLLVSAGVASANVTLTKLSSDPYTNTTSSHRTEVEPDTFSFGSTIVSAFQVGRFYDGGSSDIGWATSTDTGSSWANGFLPGITKFQGAGPYDRVSDPSVAYDAAHNTWLISSLALSEAGGVHGAAVLVSRSTDGGLTWSNPVTVAIGGDLDKNWTVCGNTPNTVSYGRCYTEWDDHGAGNLIQMSTSTDGGLTWGAAKTTANRATGLGGQPVVQPNGTVIVPINNANETAVLAFRSTDGGDTWSATTTVTSIVDHTVAGNLRSGPLVSSEIDGAGTVYVVWQDCRFERGCKSNDIVMSTSADGLSWSSVVRVPIGGTNGQIDRFLPGIGVDPSTSGAGAHLGLTYHYYPSARCSTSTCRLQVAFVSSADGGATWSPPTDLAGPMVLTWLAQTSQGYMAGDYISTSFAGSTARGVFPVANAPAGNVFDEAMYSPAAGLGVLTGSAVVTSSGQYPIANAASDHAAPQAPMTHR